MLGEQFEAAEVTEGGIVGDRAYALVERATGKVVSAKHPKKWPNVLACRASFVEQPVPGQEPPPLRMDLADGTSVMSDAPDVDAVLSRFLAATSSWPRSRRTGTPSSSTTPTSTTTPNTATS